MKQLYRKFPYPVLFKDNADYSLGAFEFKLNIVETNDDYKIIIIPLLSEKMIQSKIDTGEFAYLYHIESTYTKYRISKISNEDRLEIPIEIENMGGELQINVSIVATRDVLNYKSPHLNAVYNNYQINYKKGDYVAIDYTKILEIRNDIFGEVNRDSIINVIPDEDTESLYTNMDGPIIEVHLSKDLAEIYNSYAKNSNNKEIIFNAIMVPALADALNELQTIREIEYDERPWVKVLLSKLEQMNLNVSDINQDNKTRSTTIAETIYENPIKRLLLQIKSQEEDVY